MESLQVRRIAVVSTMIAMPIVRRHRDGLGRFLDQPPSLRPWLDSWSYSRMVRLPEASFA